MMYIKQFFKIKTTVHLVKYVRVKMMMSKIKKKKHL